MGSKSSKPTTTVTQAGIPDYLKKNYETLTKAATKLATQPFNPYKGEMVAGLTAAQEQAIARMGEIQGIGDPYFQAGADALSKVGQFTDKALEYGDKALTYTDKGSQYGATAAEIAGDLRNTQITPIEWSQEQLDKYMNPYQAEVIRATMGNIAENNAQQMQGLIGNAISKGAWGGDRAGIAQAAMARQQDLAANQTLAQLNAQNYQQAMAQFNVQQQVDLQRQQANAALKAQAGGMYTGLGGLQAQLGGVTGQLGSMAAQLGQVQAGVGSAYGSLGTGISQAAINQAMGLLQAGTVEQQTNQAYDNAQYQEFMRRQQFPYQQLGFLSNIYYGLPATNTGTSSTYAPAPSMGSQIGGALLTGLGALSDRRAKKDIEGLGQLNGHNLYKFKYKGDPDEREQVGFMADEVEKTHPEAVSVRPDGLKQVNYALAMAAKSADEVTRQKRAFGGGLGVMDDPSFDPTAGGFSGVEMPLDRLARARAATSAIESGGRYDALGPMVKGDRAYGRYQVMGKNIPSWTEMYAGRRMTPDEFRADKGAQDAVYNGRMGMYLDKYGPEGAARAWFTGSPTGKGSDGYTSADDYASRFMKGYNGGNADIPRGEEASYTPPASANDGSDFKGGLGWFDKPGLLTGDMMSGDIRMGLMQAGAAMMASKSPYAGQAIGEGLQSGLGAYAELQEKRRRDALAQSQIAHSKGALGLAERRLSAEVPEIEARTAELKQRTAAERWDIRPGLTGWQVIDRTNPQAGAVMVPFGGRFPDGTKAPPAPAGASPAGGGGAGGAPTSPPASPAPTAPAATTDPTSESGNHYDPITGNVRPGLPQDGFAPPPARSEPGITEMDHNGNRYLSDEPDDLAQPEQYPTNPQAFNPEAQPGLLAAGREQLMAGQEAAEKAQQAKITAQNMREAMSILNSNRFTKGGANFEERLALVKKINMIANLMGKQAPYQNEEAAANSLQKDTFRMGMQALQSLAGGQREAGFMQQAGIGAVPNGEQNGLGQQRLMASLEVQSQRMIDMQRFREQWARGTGGDLTGADSYFNQKRPPSYYARKTVLLSVPQPAIAELMADPTPSKMRIFDSHFGAGTARLIVTGGH